jgi:hypothetical protein
MRIHHDVHVFNQSRYFVSSCAAALMHSPSTQFLVLLTKTAAHPFPKFSIFFIPRFCVRAEVRGILAAGILPLQFRTPSMAEVIAYIPQTSAPPQSQEKKKPTPYGIGFKKFSLKQPAMPLEPQKVTWAPYDHFRLLTQLNGQHAHHDTGTAPWVMTVGSRCLLLVPQAVYRIPNFQFLANIFLWKLYNKY